MHQKAVLIKAQKLRFRDSGQKSSDATDQKKFLLIKWKKNRFFLF
jgi:hypothetical protein